MKLRISASILLSALSATAFASYTPKDSIPMTAIAAPGKVYAGIFGGGGSSNKFNIGQFGTALYTEAAGGPLAVNAFGTSSSESSSFLGLQLGYQAPDILVSSSSAWTLGPAVELEGFSMSNSTFNAALSNNTDRIPGHSFSVSYPMSRNVFLGNLVLNFNHPCVMVHPYIGFGIGGAIVRISGANSAQVVTPELGVNHYNSSTNDSDSAFAGQVKLGLGYDFNKYVTVFAEYRWLYLASTSYTFGSTVYPTHVTTTSWQVNMDAQRYNLGDIGVRFNLQ